MQAEPRCKQCGQVIPWGEAACPACDRSRFLWSVPRNALLLLSFLALIILFVMTTFAAKAYRAKRRVLAEQWYAAGERDLSVGHAGASLNDFRSALAYSPGDELIELRLAHALAAAGRLSEARAYLASLWEREPGSGTVNLELARLTAHAGQVLETTQYYHNAIYGQWDDDPSRHRRTARLELAEFLLGAHQADQAQSELIAMAADLPRDPALQTQVGTLLLQAGEHEHAMLLFRQALRLNPRLAPALAGAGEASFEVGQYDDARHFLIRASRENTLSSQSQFYLDTTTTLLGIDPFAPRLTAQDRARRAVRAFAQAMERLNGCAAARGVSPEDSSQPSGLGDVYARVLELQPKVREGRCVRNPELVTKAMDRVFEVERATERTCGEPRGLDLALLLLARAQEGREQ